MEFWKYHSSILETLSANLHTLRQLPHPHLQILEPLANNIVRKYEGYESSPNETEKCNEVHIGIPGDK